MTITLTREEAQQVLDAMIPYQQKVIATTKEYGVTVSVNNEIETAIETLRFRLSAPEPAPIAYKVNDATVYIKPPIYNAPPQPEPEPVACPKEPANIEELYTTPPQREWQGLTDEEIYACSDTPWTPTGLKCIRAIEAKLKEKNA